MRRDVKRVLQRSTALWRGCARGSLCWLWAGALLSPAIALAEDTMRCGQVVEGPADVVTLADAPVGHTLQTAPPGSVLISFDDVAAPCGFQATVRATDEYATSGVTFEGPGGNDGAAIVNECGNWGISGHSSPNFLGVNPTSSLADGGTPQGPETLWFSPPVSSVQFLAGSGLSAGEVITVNAYDAGGTLIDSQYVLLATTLAPVAVAGADIARVTVFSGPSTVFVMDDLAFVPQYEPPEAAFGPCPAHLSPNIRRSTAVT